MHSPRVFSIHSPRVFSIAPHFCTIWLAQSSPLLTYISGPKGGSALTSSHSNFYFGELLKFQFSKLIIFIIIYFFRNFLFQKNMFLAKSWDFLLNKHTHNTLESRFFPKKIFFFCKIAKNVPLVTKHNHPYGESTCSLFIHAKKRYDIFINAKDN